MSRVYNIDVDRISEARRDIMEEINDMEYLCQKCSEKIDKTIEVFDTPTAKLFREEAEELIWTGQKYIFEDLRPFIDSMDDIAEVYRSLLEDIRRIVNRGK